MGRERNSQWHTDRRDTGRPYLLSKTEFFLLLLAAAFYWTQPDWPALRFAHARARGAVQDWAARRGAGWTDWINSSRRLAETRGELDQAKSELDLMRAELRAQSLQILENDALRSLFLLPERTRFRYVYGEAVSRRILSTEARLFIRYASDSGILPESLAGAPVVASSGPDWVAVGQVVGSHGDLAEVMLLSDPRSRIGIASADSPALGSALLLGAGMDRLELDYAAHPHFLRKLTRHLRLVTALESQFPPGIPVAELTNSEGPILPRPILPYEKLRFVVVMIPSRKDTTP